MSTSTITFRPVKREQLPLLIGIAGGTGSGKTYSAMLLARGMAGGEPFAFIDTENGRGKHYADLFPEMRWGEIRAPFRPQKYADAIEAAAAEYPVVVVDSMSHEWAGDGGCLDWHDDIAGGDASKNLQAWIEPKKAHRRMMTRLLQVNAHVILCFRAEPKVEAGREGGRMVIVPKQSPHGIDGWIPISEKMLPYELTCSFLLMADQPGLPRPIKLEEQHQPMVPRDRKLDAAVGAALADWARGSTAADPRVLGEEADLLTDTLMDLARDLDRERDIAESVDHARQSKDLPELVKWLERQVATARAAVSHSAGSPAGPPAGGNPVGGAASSPVDAPAGGHPEEPPLAADLADIAGVQAFPSGRYEGRTIAEVAAEGAGIPGKGTEYLAWAARNWRDGALRQAVELYLRSHHPDTLD